MHKILCGHLLSFLWGRYVSVQLLGCVVGVCFTLEDTAIEFSKVAVTFSLLMGKKTWIHRKLNLVSGELDYETIDQDKRSSILLFDLLSFGEVSGFC